LSATDFPVELEAEAVFFPFAGGSELTVLMGARYFIFVAHVFLVVGAAGD
jgi:hypothetical protein